MPIAYDPDEQVFHLMTPASSYVFRVGDAGLLEHVYWGARVADASDVLRIARASSRLDGRPAFLRSEDVGSMRHEYPSYGTGDHREPAYEVLQPSGSHASQLAYASHRLMPGKPRLASLPAFYVESDFEADTVEVVLVDPVLQLRVVLSYTAYRDLDLICRHARFENAGSSALVLRSALSASVDLDVSEADFIQLSGAWIRERFVERVPLAPGRHEIVSRAGISGHKHNPFFALAAPGATEEAGEVRAFALVYSGNFTGGCEMEPMRQNVRAQIGIHPADFTWRLEPGESFVTPEAALVYSAEGLGGMSRTFHRAIRERLCRGPYRDRVRPVLLNNWEATYFNFREDDLVELAAQARDLGVELFVLDDGWFGARDDDTSSLGDWWPHPGKLPHGLRHLSDRIHALGMQFGIWMEPEMVSPNSELYRAHPDWCLHVADRPRSERRHQLILDLTRPDVRAFVVDAVSRVIEEGAVDYIKWDMNRPMTEVGSAALPPERQREVAHRYVLGLYEVLETLTRRFPHVLFENCASGGGRFDLGMLHYMPQTWTSDNTDAVSRLKIQHGTSLVYPPVTMGAHVSAVPNHQMGRVTPFAFRAGVAMCGNFGFELDIRAWSEEERREARQAVERYKQVRSLVQFGALYRLLSPFAGHEAAWMFVAPDGSEALVAYFSTYPDPMDPPRRLMLRGLRPEVRYLVEELGEIARGDALMRYGLVVAPSVGDGVVRWFHVKQTEEGNRT
ncbi:alpha-galactosidase [Alicyclobacillus vulcanalis]|uniref:Alpha-galactosidase n=1 Tax=Alicyclobacillus vulcanalis TaxID=252246 RepID=A0A1N7N5N4_9BACL|nr:alpha-galactosidase [Alicyclobacillus vulcanalis]SIS93666.1 alpha-galactosidase [Alicyclobacillus vulcanalis]